MTEAAGAGSTRDWRAVLGWFDRWAERRRTPLAREAIVDELRAVQPALLPRLAGDDRGRRPGAQDAGFPRRPPLASAGRCRRAALAGRPPVGAWTLTRA